MDQKINNSSATAVENKDDGGHKTVAGIDEKDPIAATAEKVNNKKKAVVSSAGENEQKKKSAKNKKKKKVIVISTLTNDSTNNGGAAKGCRVQVSNTKKPLFFYLNVAKRYIKQNNYVELSALGMAIPTVVTISEILKKGGWATEKKIGTSTVTLKDESKGRVIMKAKIEILLERGKGAVDTEGATEKKEIRNIGVKLAENPNAENAVCGGGAGGGMADKENKVSVVAAAAAAAAN